MWDRFRFELAGLKIFTFNRPQVTFDGKFVLMLRCKDTLLEESKATWLREYSMKSALPPDFLKLISDDLRKFFKPVIEALEDERITELGETPKPATCEQELNTMAPPPPDHKILRPEGAANPWKLES